MSELGEALGDVAAGTSKRWPEVAYKIADAYYQAIQARDRAIKERDEAKCFENKWYQSNRSLHDAWTRAEQAEARLKESEAGAAVLREVLHRASEMIHSRLILRPEPLGPDFGASLVFEAIDEALSSPAGRELLTAHEELGRRVKQAESLNSELRKRVEAKDSALRDGIATILAGNSVACLNRSEASEPCMECTQCAKVEVRRIMLAALEEPKTK